jgi:hypothetical protein
VINAENGMTIKEACDGIMSFQLFYLRVKEYNDLHDRFKNREKRISND